MNELIKYFNKKYSKEYGKISYPRTTIQIYQAYQSIKSYGINDEELVKLLHSVKLPKPKSLEEKELYVDCLYNKDDSEIKIDTGNLVSKESPVFTGSISMGRKEGTSIGENSYAIGREVEASGDISHAEGEDTTASGESSHAEGNGTVASGDYQHVQGKYNIEDNNNKYAHIVGNGTDDNNHSNAHTLDWEGNAWYAGQVEGTNLPYTISNKVLATIPANNIKLDNEITINNVSINKDRKYYIEFLGSKKICNLVIEESSGNEISCTIGNYAIEGMIFSSNLMLGVHKMNADDTAIDTFTDLVIYEEEIKCLDNKYLENDLRVQNSISLGRVGNIGTGSSATGMVVEASGMGSHAEGYGAKATGNFSHAEGSFTEALEEDAHAEGNNTIASSMYQHVQGKNNIEDAEGKYAHIVGNGEDFNNRANAHTLDWKGNAWYAGKLSQEGVPTEDKDLVTKKYVDDSRDNLVSNIYGNNIYNFQITEDEFNSLCNLLYNGGNNKIALNSISSDTLNAIIYGDAWYNAISFNKKIILKVNSTGSGGLVLYTKDESTDGHVNYLLLSLKSNESNIVTISYTSFIEYNYNDKIINLGILNNKVNIEKSTKNQYINATKDFELVLPNVTEYIEIHLYLTSSSTVSITFPPSIKWKDVPTIEANKVYEIIFKYINEKIGWIGEYKIYN